MLAKATKHLNALADRALKTSDFSELRLVVDQRVVRTWRWVRGEVSTSPPIFCFSFYSNKRAFRPKFQGR
jgi:hypothetical protein